MKTDTLISIDQFCLHNNVEVSFIDTLTDYGLIEIIELKDGRFVPVELISNIETFARLHYDLEINMEGIDAILQLLNRIEIMKEEIYTLKERLNLFE